MKRFFIFVCLFLSPCLLCASQLRGDVTVPFLGNPTSLHYCGKSYYGLELGYSNDFGNGSVLHALSLKGVLTSSRFGVDVTVGSEMSDRATREIIHNNSFEVNAGIAIGGWGMSIGAGWNMRGVRERGGSYEEEGSFSEFFKNLVVKHNDASVNEFTSDFSLFMSYAQPQWFSVSVFSTRLLSLSSHDVSFSVGDTVDSLGGCFMFRVPEFNSSHMRRTLLFSLFADFMGILSPSPSMSVQAVLKLNISAANSVSLSGTFAMKDLNSDFAYNAVNTISAYGDIGDIRAYLSFDVPYETFAGDESYFYATVGVRVFSFF